MSYVNPQLGYIKANAAELISGTPVAVVLNSSGNLVVANASRTPIAGVAIDPILSGKVGKAYRRADVNTSISGLVGTSLVAGVSGELVVKTFAQISGTVVQVLGVATTSGAYVNF
jgi:hypothetical protein